MILRIGPIVIGLGLGLGLGLTALACNGDQERQEDIKKLRALGVAVCAGAANAKDCPAVVAQPSTAAAPQQFMITVYAALPLGMQVDVVEPFLDPGAKYGQGVMLSKVSGSEKYEVHAALQIFSVQATLPVPTSEVMPIAPVPGFNRLRYAVRLVAGGHEEKIVGNLLVYPAGDPALTWKPPVIAATTPTSGATVGGDAALDATIENANGENLRIAWFADDGKIDNRRARATKWTVPSAGAHTLILTARGRSSGALVLQAIDVSGS